ncbi:hypothetical protein GCM10009821_13240 [Aeromicrobium halocynthiae]|uniref:DUF4229 domain-containing protein n=1 Tax=Aeromicrobium halocynthiae TaxID=560557 RepID=A0ABN2VWZ1_9ACTN
MSLLAKFTLARVGIFLVTYVLMWGVGQFFLEWGQLTNLVILLLALFVSSIASLFLLADMRAQLAQRVQGRAERMNERVEESRRAEDVD